MSQHVLNKFKILEKYYRTGHLDISVFFWNRQIEKTKQLEFTEVNVKLK